MSFLQYDLMKSRSDVSRSNWYHRIRLEFYNKMSSLIFEVEQSI